jgi:ribokinase
VRLAVVGHVEWVEFATVDHVPRAGEVVHASDTFAEPAGGGAVVAVELARLGGEATLFTALGNDELADRARERLTELGVRVQAAHRDAPTRRALTFIDRRGERTIATLGERLEPHAADPLTWEELAGADGVYFTAGDRGALAAARGARVLVASPRARAALAGGVPIDAIVMSASDAIEAAALAAADPQPELLLETRGVDGGSYRGRAQAGSWQAAPLPAPSADSYGCGDTFAAAFTYALAAGRSTDDAVRLAATEAAACLTRRGPYG